MNKNKKLISLVAAIAMIFTMLSSFTFANAAGEGFTLSTPTYNDDGTISVTVGYVGLEKGLADGEFKIAMPAEVTAVTGNPASAEALVDGVYTYRFTYGTTPNTKTSDVITTLTLTLSTPLTETKDITIAEGSYLDDGDATEFDVGATTNALTAPTVTIPLDPNAPTPKPVTDVTPAPVATEPPSEAPEIDDPVTSTVGYVFGTPVVSDDGLTITVDVNYVGLEKGLADGEFKIAMPAEVTAVKGDPASAEALVDGVYTYRFTYGTTPNTKTADKIVTLALSLSKPLAYNNQLTIAKDSYFDDADANEFVVGKDNVLASNVILPAFGGTEEPDVKGTIALSKAVTVEVDDTPVDGVSEHFIIPVVKKGDAEAVYGTDYVAKIGDKKLTDAQYSNLINGYFNAPNVTDIVANNGIKDINDVVGKITFEVYDKTVTVAAQIVNRTTGTIENADDKTVGVGNTPSTPKPSKPSIGVTVKPTTVYVGDSVTVTAKITNPKDGGVLTVAATDESLDYVAASGIKTTVADDNKSATTTFKAADKGTNAVVLNYTYTYTDAEGVEQTVPFEKKITIKEKTTDNGGSGSGSGSSSGSGGTGPIANGSNTTVTNPYGPSMFKDLGDAPWASEAITMLASKNIVSGRDENTFDPNANITRAEYCQILVGAIGKSAEYADASFDDVPTDAWFYHAVAVASKYGIVSGYGDGNFGPYDLITRQDMALMTQRAAEAVGKNLTAVSDSSFTDADQISEYAQDAVYTLANAGVINGMGDGTFAPKANATRAQASVIIYTTFVK